MNAVIKEVENSINQNVYPVSPVCRIRFILMRFRIRGSASGITDPDLDPTKNLANSNCFLNFFCKRNKTHNDVFFFLILSLLFTYIKQN